ncbi:ATP-binding protein [Paenibacillus chartarius]|uniref:histidine kinase n=1 Tax=Paenibacillus chartarius TaxID=747481 RepID=A0ABV6DL74_9BACL
MNFRYQRILLLLLSLAAFLSAFAPSAHAIHGNPLRAERGELDASTYDIAHQPPLPLDGEWEFYGSQLLDPAQFTNRTPEMRQADYLSVPKAWPATTRSGITVPSHGYATYRLTVRLGSELQNRQLAVYMPSVATSYKLWINGRLAASNGIVADNREQMVPANYRKVVYFDTNEDQVELVVQAANFVQRKGGLWQSLRLGSADAVSFERDTNIAVEMFLAGALTLMGIYHIGLYAFRRSEPAALLFGLLSLAFAVRSMLLGETMAVRLFPGLAWEPAVKIEYISGMIALPLFMYFCRFQYKGQFSKRWAGIALTFTTLCCLLVLATPARVYTYMMLPVQLFAVVMLLYALYVFMVMVGRKQEGALRNFIALLVFFGTFIHDTLFYNHLIHTKQLLGFGLVTYLLVQAVNISSRFSRSFTRAEQLSRQLRELNDTLEHKVSERTAELERSNAKLQQAYNDMTLLEASRRMLLSNISHELKTPLTSIQGYTRAIIDGVISGPPKKYLELIYEKSKILQHIFQDLLELSKLETGKMEFRFELLPAKDLLHLMYHKYEWEAESKGLTVTLEENIEPRDGCEAMINVDTLRIEQAFANLVMNAVKFTAPGGSIQVRAALIDTPDTGPRFVISVSDTGPGIPEHELGFIFDRFYKGAYSRKIQSAGAGLGLAIAKEMMGLHGGAIEVHSTSGQGSTFSISLPAVWIPL